MLQKFISIFTTSILISIASPILLSNTASAASKPLSEKKTKQIMNSNWCSKVGNVYGGRFIPAGASSYKFRYREKKGGPLLVKGPFKYSVNGNVVSHASNSNTYTFFKSGIKIFYINKRNGKKFGYSKSCR